MHRELEMLAPRVFVYPRDETPHTIQPNIGVIQLPDETILIDGGNSPRHARRIMSVLSNAGFAPVSTIIVTHHHWDHCFGLAYYAANRIIAHEQCAQHLSEYAKRDWSASALRADTAANPHRETMNNTITDAIPDFRDFRIGEPTITFSRRLTLYISDDVTLELEHVGGRHASDSIVVRLPQQRVMFLGDCYYPLPVSEREPDDVDLDLTMLDDFLDQDYALYVDGHGAPRDTEAFRDMIAWERGRQAANQA